MKNKVISLILFLVLCFPFMVSASACKVISGDGSKLGDEIACGTEHFYVLNNKDGKVEMLSKYNLYVGDKIEKGSPDFLTEEEAERYCDTLIPTYGEENVLVTEKYDIDFEEETSTESVYFCRVYTPLEYTEVKQSELAIGLYPKSSRDIGYPIYGAVYLGTDGDVKEFDENGDMIPSRSKFKDYFNSYKETLEKLGVTVEDIGFIKKSGVQNILDKVSTSKIVIPGIEGYEETSDGLHWDFEFYGDYNMLFNKVSIRDYIPDEYKWLIGTSYWTGSAMIYTDEWGTYIWDEFLTTLGDYCAYDRGCTESKIGLGIRPVVTISDTLIKEEIKEEKEEKKEEIVPDTSDKIIISSIIGITSLLVVFSVAKSCNRKYN